VTGFVIEASTEERTPDRMDMSAAPRRR